MTTVLRTLIISGFLFLMFSIDVLNDIQSGVDFVTEAEAWVPGPVGVGGFGVAGVARRTTEERSYWDYRSCNQRCSDHCRRGCYLYGHSSAPTASRGCRSNTAGHSAVGYCCSHRYDNFVLTRRLLIGFSAWGHIFQLRRGLLPAFLSGEHSGLYCRSGAMSH